MVRYITLLLFIGLAWGQKPSIYIFNIKENGIKDNRPVKAIQNIIQKSFRKSKQYKVKNDNQVIDYINEYKIDLKHCDTNCFKNIGFNNELDYLVTGKVKKTGTNWNLVISIIDVKTSAEPVLISVKSKQGTMKLISKLEKKLNKYILNIVEQNQTVFMSSKDLAVKPQEKETVINCSDGEVELWGSCYSILQTDTLIINNNPVYKNGFMKKEKDDLVGEIPHKITLLKNLKYLDLSHNNLKGKLPENLNELSDLKYLDLSNNRLGGDFENILEYLLQIEIVKLNGNEWYYHIPIYADTICGFNTKIENNWNYYFGLTHGSLKEWYSEDLLKTEVEFEYGVLKKLNHWDINGVQLIFNGNGIFKDYWYDSLILMDGDIENGLMEGEWKFYYGDGQMEKWRSPGIMDIDGNDFIKGIPKGENKLVASIIYKNGKGFTSSGQHEMWTDSNPVDGMIESKYYYHSGELFKHEYSNPYIYYKYDRDGEIIEELSYNNLNQKNLIKYYSKEKSFSYGNGNGNVVLYPKKSEYRKESIYKYVEIWIDNNTTILKCYENGIECLNAYMDWDGCYCID